MARMISANYTIRHECLWRAVRGNQIVYHRRIENRHRRGYETATGENRSSGVRPPSHLRPKVTGEEIRKCSSAKIRSRTVEEKPQKVYHRASEKALRGGYQIAAGKEKERHPFRDASLPITDVALESACRSLHSLASRG